MPYVVNFLDLQVDHSSDFMAWRPQWESYMILSGLSEESDAKKDQALNLCFSSETLSIWFMASIRH